MKRGDLVSVALQGDLGKPRPAVVIQADVFSDLLSTVILPVTSTIIEAPILRYTLNPSPSNGLRTISQVMIDKPSTISRTKIGTPFGVLEDTEIIDITRRLAVVLGIG